MYVNGEGMPGGRPNFPAAFALYQRACTASNARACSELGVMYLNGESVPRDPARAAQLFEASCRGNHPRGCNNLGFVMVNGNGVPRDRDRGVQLLQAACRANDELACRRVTEAMSAAP